MIKKIEEVLNNYIRPSLGAHHGDIEIVEFENNHLKVRLTGQCSSCMSSRDTFEELVESELKNHIPELKSIELIEGVSDDLIDFAKKILNKEL